MSNADYPWIKNYDDGLSWDMSIEPKPVFNLLDDTAKSHGEKPGFNFLGKQYTWYEIHKLSNQFAAGWQSLGVKKGDHVGLFLPNCPYYLIAYYSVLKIGAVVVNFNPLYAERELAHQIEDSETDIMITLDLKLLHKKMHEMLHNTRLSTLVVCSFADSLPLPKKILFSIFKAREKANIKQAVHTHSFKTLIQHDGSYQAPNIDPFKDLAVLQYTGGTTGVPKAAMITHANIYTNTVQAVSWMNDGSAPGTKKMLGVLPFFHVFAMTAIMNFSVLNGFEIIALPRVDLNDTLKLIDREKPHFFPAVPAIYTAINACRNLERYDLSSLEYCISGGAPLPVQVKKTFEEITGCVVVEGYGLTETSPVVCVNPLRGISKPGSIGLPIPQTIVEIVDPDDKKTIVPIGARGELCVRGPQVMVGYWQKPEATSDTIINGRLHTGDIAIMDEEGYVFIVDRLKDMIITNGYNVYPRNVEEAIYLHPGIEECVVAGLPDKNRGEIVKAWIKLKKGYELTGKDLKAFLEDKISPMEIPRLIEFRDDPLPKTMIGKLSRKDLVHEEERSA